jgi:primosomal protein N' (replication factor Y)
LRCVAWNIGAETANACAITGAYCILLIMYADVIFPIKLTPLTYKIPDGLGADIKGCIVTAPLMNKNRFGLVVNVNNELDFGMIGAAQNRIKKIVSVHDRFATENNLRFLQWISDYYLAPAGVVLKSSFFEEAAAGKPEAPKRQRRKRLDAACVELSQSPERKAPQEIMDEVVRSIKEKNYSAMLYHAPDIESEYLSTLGVLSQIRDELRGIIVLVPEISFIGRLEPHLREIFGERLSVLHARLSKRDRLLAINKIISGQSDVALGTRSAILAPISQSRLIVVLEEHSSYYKAEEGPRYNARDLAVMRAYMDKSCVMLMSVCPSVESVYNVRKSKYKSLNRAPGQSEVKRPRIKIISFSPRKKGESSLSPTIISEARTILQNNEQAIFLVGRKGYSLIRCEDCGHIEYCDDCAAPMIFYKSSGMLKCHLCGCERAVPELCGECGGASVSLFTSGVERVREDLEALLTRHATPSSKAGISSPDTTAGNGTGLSGFVPFIIGSAGAKRKKSACGQYSAAILMNIDLLVARPDFRAQEHAFQEMIEVSQIVKPEGSIFIQTRSRGSKFLKCLRDYDFDSFYEMELSQRKEISYPPFEKIVLLSIQSGTKNAIPATLSEIMGEANRNVTALGPVEVHAHSKSHAYCWQIIFKSADQRRLRDAVRKIVDALQRNKEIKVTIDVDPLKI